MRAATRPAIERNAPPPEQQLNGKIRIERGVPVPLMTRQRAEHFPWLDMEPGNSFWVPINFDDDKPEPEIFLRRMVARALSAGKKHNTKFLARLAPQDPQDTNPSHQKEGVRVWRCVPPKPNGRGG